MRRNSDKEKILKQTDVNLDISEVKDNHHKNNIIAIGGGKGGVGKTVMAASLGTGMAMMKKRTVIVDGDFGGADLHTVMGFEKPNKTYFNFYNHEYENLNDILLEHPDFDHLKIMSGAIGSPGMANLSYQQKMRFIRHLRKIIADFIILDLGAGTSYNVLDLFLAADQGIIIVTPDPMSILEGYNFVKQALFRKIAHIIRGHGNTTGLIKNISQTETHKSQSTIKDLTNQISEMDQKLGEKIIISLSKFHPMLLANMTINSDDENNILAIKSAAQELLSTEIEYIGAVHEDETVRESIQKMVPLLNYDPKCPASKDLTHIITNKLFQMGKLRSWSAKHKIQKMGITESELKKIDQICSVNCLYWNDCEFKKGGYPCQIKHYVGIKGFQRE